MHALKFQLTNFVERQGKNHFWIGLTDREVSGTLKWRYGHTFPNDFKSYWEQGQPNEIGDKKVCVQVSRSGYNERTKQFQWSMRDSKCDKEFSIVCEKRPNRGKADIHRFHNDKWYLMFIGFRMLR